MIEPLSLVGCSKKLEELLDRGLVAWPITLVGLERPDPMTVCRVWGLGGELGGELKEDTVGPLDDPDELA